MKLELIQPPRCTANLPDDLGKEYLVAEEKLDGARYMLYLNADPYGRRLAENTLLSRRVSTVDNRHVDRSQNLPHITTLHYAGLEGTVLDGEVMGDDFLKTNSILNSSTSEALRKQEETGFLRFNVFDVPFFRGKDIRGLPLEKRRMVLNEVASRMSNEHVRVIPQVKTGIEQFFTDIVSGGGEGVIVKDSRLGYGTGWSKMKKSYDVSVIISGFKSGNGKYAGQVGALALSVLHDGKLVEVGFASGFNDTLRRKMTEDFDSYRGRVVDVFAQEIQNGKRSSDNPVGRLRHPTFHRFRDDVNAEDCTSQKLWDDLKSAKVKASRFKKGE